MIGANEFDVMMILQLIRVNYSATIPLRACGRRIVVGAA